MPADDDEPLTSIAVEARMPDLHRLDGAVAGTMLCRYCATRYPAEDLACPRCGAHASAS
jgi:predicted amidophosphoribosyltransferase